MIKFYRVIKIYKRIKELREDNDLLQKQIAITLNITRQQYGLYESGIRDFPIEKIKILADFYNTSIDYIVERTNEKKPYPRKK